MVKKFLSDCWYLILGLMFMGIGWTSLYGPAAGMSATFVATVIICSIWYNIEGERYGRNRRSEANSRDSSAVTSTGTDPRYSTVHPSSGGDSRPSLDSYLEKVESDMPILAHRVAALTLDGSPKPFRSLNQGVPFGLEATAYCTVGLDPDSIILNQFYKSLGQIEDKIDPRHPREHAPHLSCTCGFYALPSDLTPWSYDPDLVTLSVELAGVVVEHEKGYRAEWQRVLEVQVPPCPFCQKPSELLICDTNGKFRRAVCSSHNTTGDVAVSFEDASFVIGVPVICNTDLLTYDPKKTS